ncbi:MAG: outer membrane lipid asymmetry maintenance protein MlaD, partial [Caulobacteraceae bacterium]|nr:outer membrane lipid asymmetry maintenance protein MlaD [Caulobacter sp.]
MDGRQQYAETGVGAAVILAAAAFLVYALSHTTQGAGAGTYPLIAKFGQAGSLAPGSDVKVAGVKVGSVTGITLDPKTFLAKTTISVNDGVKLPVDSSIKVTSDSLLGGQHVAIDPGGSMQDMKPGQEFANTQGAVDLFGLIGQVIRPQGGGAAATPSSATPAAAPA